MGRADNDLPLTEKGHEQADQLSRNLQEFGIDSIYASSMLRATQTALAVADDRGMPVTITSKIREVGFGAETLASESGVLNQMRNWLDGIDRSEGYGGESYDELMVRFGDFWSEFVHENRGKEGAGLVVAHGAALMLAVPELCDNTVSSDTVFSTRLDYTSTIVAELNEDGTLNCREWNGVPVT
ncbi:phosphoglycerate mutase [Rhodococcus ruber BKS 20-38]|uniref:Phosphoglycerate mutase n=2 Tax=Rhodococcus ruber TaxID=1830 RepID=M2Y2H2_9NOCA|nr:phosphoglycerate mutase [Rhodococcus ruber BKS 20-38]